MNELCIYHGKCADGFTAAWVVRKALGAQTEFYSGVYQEPPPDVRGRDVVMVDFSYKRPVLEKIAAEANSLLILDHHKTAAEDLAGLPGAIFDMNRSGAGLTWDHFNPGVARPRLVDYVEDRDLWRFNLKGSREVSAYVFAHEYDFGQWDALAALLDDEAGLQTVIGAGAAIERKHHKDVAELVGVCKRRMKIAGIEVWGASLPYTLTSDAGHLMASEGEPFAACYWDTPDGRVFSLRSHDTGADVSAIAKQYGGGGHPRASGFRVPLSEIAQFEI